MNFLRNKKIQKLSACFLLTVFVLINAVKTFHTHEFSYTTQQQSSNKNAATIKANFFCAICDFQFFKDGDLQVAEIQIATPVHLVTVFYHHAFSLLTSAAITSSVRGPPVLFS